MKGEAEIHSPSQQRQQQQQSSSVSGELEQASYQDGKKKKKKKSHDKEEEEEKKKKKKSLNAAGEVAKELNDPILKSNADELYSRLMLNTGPKSGGKPSPLVEKGLTALLLHSQSPGFPIPQRYKSFYMDILEKNIPLKLIGNKRLRRVLHFMKNKRERKNSRKPKSKKQRRTKPSKNDKPLSKWLRL